MLRRLLISTFIITILSSSTHAADGPAMEPKKEPLWEAGIGGGTVVFPDYRGSDEIHAYPLPLPYFVYRGPILKADRDGIRGRFFNRDFVELTVSVNATVPVNSDDNEARRGMPDLRPTLEFGPSLDFHLWRSDDRRIKLDFELPFRLPVTLESSPQQIGWVVAPRFNVDIADLFGTSGWNVGVAAGPIFASRNHHDYFYSVAPEYATTTRPAYAAGGGYSGSQLLAAVSKRFPRFWIGAYVRYDTLTDSEFITSPLVRRHSYLAGGIGAAWVLGQSRILASGDE